MHSSHIQPANRLRPVSRPKTSVTVPLKPHLPQKTSRITLLDGGHLVRRTRREHPSARRTAFGTDIDDPVGDLHHVEVVFDDDDRVSAVDQLVQHVDQLADILEMEPRSRLVEDIERAARIAFREFGGHRYNRETLEVKYKGKNIDDVLNMTVNMAVEFFENIPAIHQKLRAIQEVGLGYLTLGQPCTTLSGGESQRIKLSSELSKRDTGRTLYILDEPTTGLHFEDIRLLLDVLNKLVDRGNTVIVIEHNLDVIKVADHIIDIGPEGGAAGGEIVAAGTPHEIACAPRSYTGEFLKKLGL